jgi:hypothetical protein
MMLDTRIVDFATLVGLILVLLTLFTGQRASTLRALTVGADTKLSDGIQELVLDIALAIFTVLLFVTGLPIAIAALKAFHPLAYSGPLRGGFVISWGLLIGLMAWQGLLLHGAVGLIRKL